MFRKIYQGGSSRKQAPRLAIRESDIEPPREAPVRPCEWPLHEFMVHAGFKDEFDPYIQNAGLEDFVSDKCRQYYHLTDSFVQRFKFTSQRNTHIVMFDLYDKYYTMDLEDFSDACKIPQCGILSEPRKTEYNDFLASITMGETRDITQASMGSIHFPTIHYFALFIGRCINGKHDHSHLCASDLSVLKCAVLGDKRYNLGLLLRGGYILMRRMAISLVGFMPPV